MTKSSYTVVFAPRIEKQLKLIPKDIRILIFERIEKLTSTPRPENIEPLLGTENGTKCHVERFL